MQAGYHSKGQTISIPYFNTKHRTTPLKAELVQFSDSGKFDFKLALKPSVFVKVVSPRTLSDFHRRIFHSLLMQIFPTGMLSRILCK